MKKNRIPTLADLKAGNVTADQRRQFSEQVGQVGTMYSVALELSKSTIGKEFKRIVENYQAWKAEATALFDALSDAGLPEAEVYISQHPPSAGAIAFLILVTQDRFKTEQGTRGAAARHSKPGGSHEKTRKICELWASGKYSSRDICAEQECAELGMSFSTARRALRGTPNPLAAAGTG